MIPLICGISKIKKKKLVGKKIRLVVTGGGGLWWGVGELDKGGQTVRASRLMINKH